MLQVKFLKNKMDNSQGLYDADLNLIIALPIDFKVSFFHDINIKKVKLLLKGSKFKRLIMQYDYKKLESAYYLK